MAIYVKDNNKVTDIFANVNGSKKRIKSVWVNKNGIVTRVFGDVERENDPYEIAPASAYSHFAYTLDDENGIITLGHYNNDNREENVIVYPNYNVNGKIYKTKIKDKIGGMFSNNIKGYDIVIKTITFKEGIDTSNVTYTEQMFQNCKELVSIDLGDFDTNNVNNMTNMFRGSEKLQVIYVTEGKWSTTLAKSTMYTLYGKQVSGTTNMFYDCGVSSVTYK